MMKIKSILFLIATVCIAVLWAVEHGRAGADNSRTHYLVITSDTLLSSVAEALLPATRYTVESVLPPGQCPGHYDIKLSDIEKVQKADLVIAFRGMSFMENANPIGRHRLVVDNDARNWMSPESYIVGLRYLAEGLAERFPEDRSEIIRKKEESIRLVRHEAQELKGLIERAGIAGHAVLGSSMQKEPLEWMGFRVVGVYGRPESISTRDVVQLVKTGRKHQAFAVVDNLQSGPETGKQIAATLGIPHIILNNFPSERGYLATLKDNVEAVLSARAGK